jgi:flagellin
MACMSGLRINTNLSSLTAQFNLSKVRADVDQATHRLATGLRINTGADDPAGLIASESLRLRSTQLASAINNSQRASLFYATAEGALAEVTALLQNVNRLTHMAANEAGLTRDEIAALQLELDNAVDSIDRVAATTTFGNRTILDGSLGYTLSGVGDLIVPVDDVRVTHAQVSESAPMAVDVEVLTEGVQAIQTVSLRRTFLDAAVSGTSTIRVVGDVGTEVVTFNNEVVTMDDVVSRINLAESTTGVHAERVDTWDIEFTSVNYGPDASVQIDVDEPAAAYWADSDDFLTTVEGEWLFRIASNDGTEIISFDGPQTPAAVLAAVNGLTGLTGLRGIYENNEFTFVSEATGAAAWVQAGVMPRVYFNGADTTDTNITWGGAGTPAIFEWNSYADFLAAAGPGTSTLQVRGNLGQQALSFGPGGATEIDIVNAVNAVSGLTGVSAGFAAGTITFTSTNVGADQFVEVKGLELPESTWADQTDFITQAATATNQITVRGAHGQQVLTFPPAVYTPTDIVNTVNGVTASTGVVATLEVDGIHFWSDEFGPNESVFVNAMHPIPALTTPIDHSEAAGTACDVTTNGGDSAISIRSINHDPRTEVDGLFASLRSLNLHIDMLFGDFAGISVGGKGDEGQYVVTTRFFITGGGTTVQLGPKVDRQGRMSTGIPSVYASNLGNPNVGYLHQLRSGGTYDLVGGLLEEAAAIVQESINQVSTLRAELGMVERHVLAPSITSNQIALENTMAADSVIRDTDFAVEVAHLTRGQILTTAVGRALGLSNAQPMAALELLSQSAAGLFS